MQNQDVFVQLTNYFFVHALKKGKISIPHICQLRHITSKWITDYLKIYICILFWWMYLIFSKMKYYVQARWVNHYHRMKRTCLIYHINYKLHYPKSPIFSSLFLLFASQKVSSLSSLLVFPSLLLSLKHAHCIHLVCMGNIY